MLSNPAYEVPRRDGVDPHVDVTFIDLDNGGRVGKQHFLYHSFYYSFLFVVEINR